MHEPAQTIEVPTHATMASTIIEAPRRLRLREAPVPQPGEGEVRIRLEGCGVCASNIPPWEGRPWFEYPMAPGQLGHEGWGRIDALGPGVGGLNVGGVGGLREGDCVAFMSDHAYAEHDVTAANMVVPLPDQLAEQPFPGEPLGCAMNIFERADIQPGQTVAIVGVGFLGALLTQLATGAGARVVALSRRPFALAAARRGGASETIELSEDADRGQIMKRVADLTGGGMCERVIEATGKQGPLDLAGELVRVRGRLVIAGFHQDGPRTVNMQSWNWRGIDVVNAHERDPARYTAGIQRAVEAASRGELDPAPLYTHRYPLSRLDEALEATRTRPEGFMKALVMME